MEWEVVIGLETHVQLSTKTKIFSAADNEFGGEPNSHACAIDMALPGALPVLNREAVLRAAKFGLAIGAKVAEKSVFDRKNYFYPDLPKGYQISQFELPIVLGGQLSCLVTPKKGDPYVKVVDLTRAHLEEDAGKSNHGIHPGETGVDLNRAGTPLIEIVTEPVMRSSDEAVAYARTLHALVVWLGITEGNMQNGNFRCDANVSVRPKGETKLGTRCEIKNLNSFRFLKDAIDYEVDRQIELIEDGEKVIQQTRLYDPDRNETRPMRSKEDSMDYRYFPDPDLLPCVLSAEEIATLKQELPELPQQMFDRLKNEDGLSEYDAGILTSSHGVACYYDELAHLVKDKKAAANWVMGEVSAAIKQSEGLTIDRAPVTPKLLAAIMARVSDGTINLKGAKKVFAALWNEEGTDVDALIERLGLKQISDTGAIEAMVDEVLAENAAMVEQYKAGKQKAFNALVGQVMKAARGKASPALVNQLLKKKLG